MAIFRPSTWGNNNSEDGLDSRTIGIIVAVVSVSILSAMVLCVCVRRRRRVKSSNNTHAPSLPTHMSQLPPPPPAYIRPSASADLPPYRPRQDRIEQSGPHAAWAIPSFAPVQPRLQRSTSPPSSSALPSAATGAASSSISPPAPRRSIFRRPVPPLYTSEDLATSSTTGEAGAVPQVTPYEHRRGQNPFGERGVDGRHPGVEGSVRGAEGGTVQRSVSTAKAVRVADEVPEDAPPGYAEASRR
ncbi:uncharacterized protein MKK02DRAFT_45246 [Dioszegia hungarica]|uniref:Uncharacterized protein n=1 Tax=Dioszegia hungarica TaxID=4972 RepID=A0AA38H8Q5_9TREE|nr:uncharacterized protein MKK02DRAFT_45246 [Dioszegia hungarica]KAI9636542.1 hypothetical protein MKK02DRAFT_45246 [Dioszegia hungarica]